VRKLGVNNLFDTRTKMRTWTTIRWIP